MVETIISDGLIRHVHDRNIDLYVTKPSFDNPFKEPILACTKDVRQTWSFRCTNLHRFQVEFVRQAVPKTRSVLDFILENFSNIQRR